MLQEAWNANSKLVYQIENLYDSEGFSEDEGIFPFRQNNTTHSLYLIFVSKAKFYYFSILYYCNFITLYNFQMIVNRIVIEP